MSKYSENIPPSLRGAIEWMLDDIKPNTILLDFGCSTGYFGKYIKDIKGCNVYGVEISSDKKEARKVLDGVYSFDLDGKWPEEVYERKYDYLFFGDVIEHLKDPRKVLEKSKTLLKKGGIIFISTPNVAHISVRLELMGGNFEYEPMGILDSTHLKYFTKRSLTNLVKNAGYDIQSINYTTNDYPDRVIKTILAKDGLIPTNTFWKMVNKPEARAFQYKLIVRPANTTAPSRQKTVAPKKPELIRNAAMNDLEQKVKNLKKHAKEQATIIAYYVNKTKALEDDNTLLVKEVNIIKTSRTYKAAHGIRQIFPRR